MSEHTVEQILDAMELNGYKKTKGEYINWRRNDYSVVHSACAIGQASLNLDEDADALALILSEATCKNICQHYPNYVNADVAVTHLNDSHPLSVAVIARKVRKAYMEYINEEK